MSSSSSGQCPLCLKVILVKNFKRHCDNCHDSVNTKEKYQKLLLKMKETINNRHRQTSTSELTSSNESLTTTSNEALRKISEQTEIESLVVNECASSSPDVIPDDNTSLDNFQFENFIQIKNKICGDIQYILKQAQFASKLINLAFDETVSIKSFLIETTSSLGKLKESLSDVLILCNTTLEKIPSTSITIDELKSTETFVSRDPSNTKVYNETELRYLVDQGPYQPILSRYPVNESLNKNNDTCHFVPKWFQEFPLIEYSPLTDSIYCFCCRLFGHGPGTTQSESAWTLTGIRTWNKIKGSQGAGKKGKIYVHITSESHQSSLKRYMIFKEHKNNVDYMLDKNLQQQEQHKIEQKKSNEEVIKILIDCARYLTRQSLAFRGHIDEEGNFHQLVHLLSRYNPLLDD